MLNTINFCSFILATAELVRLGKAQDSPCTLGQLAVSAPKDNPWKALTEEDSVGVTDLLQRQLELTGNEGSR
jgi:hypothetical protein